MEEGEFYLKTMDHIYIGDILLCLFKETDNLIYNGKVILKKGIRTQNQIFIKSEMSVWGGHKNLESSLQTSHSWLQDWNLYLKIYTQNIINFCNQDFIFYPDTNKWRRTAWEQNSLPAFLQHPFWKRINQLFPRLI